MSYGRSSIGPSPVTAMFLLLAVVWGTAFVAIEVGLHAVPALSFAAIRYTVAGAIILGYAAVATDRWRPRGRAEWLSTTAAGVFVIAIYHGALYLGELHVSGAVAAVVISLTPILTAAFASGLFGRTSVDVVEALGFLLGVAGVAVVAAPGGSGATANLVGVGLVFVGAVSFAIGGILSRPNDLDLPIETMEAWAMLLGSAVLWAGAGARGESLAAVDWTLPAVLSLAYLTLISGCAGFLLYFELLDRIGAAELNLVSYLEPIVAAVVSWMLIGSVIDTSTLVGFATIFVGFGLLKRHVLADLAVDTATAVRSQAVWDSR